MKKFLKTLFSLLITLTISMAVFAQAPERNIGYSAALKPKVGMGYEYDLALANYTKTFRTDSAYTIRVTRVTGGPRGGYDILTEPLRTWTELDATRPYAGDAASRAWANVLKLCDDVQYNYYSYDIQNSNPLAKSTSSTKYVNYVYTLDPKADKEAFVTEIKKAANLLKQAGYNFSLTNSISGETRYAIQMQLVNGWKDMDRELPSYKELFLKAYPEKGAWEKHIGIRRNSLKDFYTEYRTVRSTVSTR
jgi:hypothetical protein